MNLGELRDSFRVKTGDTARPYLWLDPEVDGYINEAYTEAVDRGLVIYDRESFTVDVEVGVTDYQLDPSIIRVKAANVTVKDGVELDEPEPVYLSNRRYDGTFSEPYQPQGYRIDEDGMFVLVASPTVTATIALEVHRYPKTLVEDDDEPEIQSIYHAKMLAWALKLAYLKQDADTFDAKASERFEAEFTRTFGPSKTAQQHRQRRRKVARSYKTPGY